MKHSIGDSVVALTNTPNYRCQPRVKGQIYKVKDIMYCSKCGIQTINIGYTIDIPRFSGILECNCGSEIFSNGLHWTESKYFAPVTEAFLKECEEKEEYELCSTIKEILTPTI